MKLPEQLGRTRPYHGAMIYVTKCVRAGIVVAMISVLGWLGGCSDAPTSAPPPPTTAIVSDPAPAAAFAPGTAKASVQYGSAGDEVAYVSLTPGTVPTGATATIRRVGSAASLVTTVSDGGFDPVPVQARTNDSIEVVVEDASGATIAVIGLVVAARRPPIVVRTDPPRKKNDVPLNSAMVVVFSEPIDVRTLTAGSLQLRQGATSVAGRLEFQDAEHLRATFVPAAPLVAATTYQLVVSQGIRDLDGEPLETPVTVQFATGSSPAAVASVTVDPLMLTVAPGETLPLTATAYDSSGNALGGLVGSWSSGNPTVATVSAAGVVAGVSVGTTTVTATVEGTSATATISVTRLVFASVSAGYEFSCGVTTDAAAYCWGANDVGQLGNGSRKSTTTPVAVAGGLSFVSVSAGDHHACGLATDGTAYCWGYGGGSGATLGHAATELCQSNWPCSTRPVAVEGGLRFVAITAGETHTCGLMADGAAYCWGNNWFGELGNGEKYTWHLSPVRVSGDLTFRSLSAGGAITCGVTTADVAYCWGWGNGGALGYQATDTCSDGDTARELYVQCSTLPVAIDGGLTFSLVKADGELACGITTAATAYCWGWYPHPDGGGGYLQPQAVPGGLTFTDLSVNGETVCGITPNGAAYCAGRVMTALGPDWVQTERSSVPREVPGGLPFATLSVGGGLSGGGATHSCGMTPGGTVYCWGLNGRGALGNGLTVSSLVPVRVAGQP